MGEAFMRKCDARLNAEGKRCGAPSPCEVHQIKVVGDWTLGGLMGFAWLTHHVPARRIVLRAMRCSAPSLVGAPEFSGA